MSLDIKKLSTKYEMYELTLLVKDSANSGFFIAVYYGTNKGWKEYDYQRRREADKNPLQEFLVDMGLEVVAEAVGFVISMPTKILLFMTDEYTRTINGMFKDAATAIEDDSDNNTNYIFVVSHVLRVSGGPSFGTPLSYYKYMYKHKLKGRYHNIP